MHVCFFYLGSNSTYSRINGTVGPLMACVKDLIYIHAECTASQKPLQPTEISILYLQALEQVAN